MGARCARTRAGKLIETRTSAPELGHRKALAALYVKVRQEPNFRATG
jgi:hypothetical protein